MTGSDIDQATTLLTLYQVKAKLREQNGSSLQKAREKINALSAKHQAPTDVKSGSRPGLHGRTSSQVTFPKQN
jgi:hypothetical protein